MLKKLPKIDKRILIGSGAIMLAALFWSLDGVFLRPKFYILPASLVVFLEHSLGFIVLSPFLFLHWYKVKKLSRKSWLAILWVCVFGGLLGTLMITKAFFAAMLGETTFSTVIILQKLQPIFALIMARLILKEKLSSRFYFWAMIGIVAGYFLAFGHVNIFEVDWMNSAAFFALIAAFSFGSSTVFGKRIVNHLDFRVTTALRFGITAILSLLLIIFTGSILNLNSVTNIQWFYLLIIVFSSGALSMFIYYFGLKRVSASTATICELFWPFSAIILDYILNGNVLNSIQIISSLALLIAFYFVVREGKMKGRIFNANVVWGKGRGRKLGFPTANLDVLDLDISHGVYLVNVYIGKEKYKGLLHFGHKETFHEETSAEVFIKDFSEDIYKENIKVEVVSRIRNIRKFEDSDALRRQIKTDLEYLD
jgi:drug/metabolite transporter (DMT)-like permease